MGVNNAMFQHVTIITTVFGEIDFFFFPCKGVGVDNTVTAGAGWCQIHNEATIAFGLSAQMLAKLKRSIAF